MSKYSKVGVLVAVMALSGLLASSAGAVEWHTNGHKVFTSNNAGATRLVIHPSETLVECASSSGNGTLKGPTFAGATFPSAGTVTPVFGSCTVSGAAGYSVLCSPATLSALSYSGGQTLASAGGGVTTGSITSIDCRLSIGATTCSTITGTAHGHYINPNPITTGNGTLTVTKTYLQVHKIGAGCAAVPNGTGTYGKPDVGSGVGDTTYVVPGPEAPYIFTTS